MSSPNSGRFLERGYVAVTAQRLWFGCRSVFPKGLAGELLLRVAPKAISLGKRKKDDYPRCRAIRTSAAMPLWERLLIFVLPFNGQKMYPPRSIFGI